MPVVIMLQMDSYRIRLIMESRRACFYFKYLYFFSALYLLLTLTNSQSWCCASSSRLQSVLYHPSLCLSVALHFSSCVWHSTRRFFDVLLANCVSSGVGCWTSETTLTWPFLWARVEYAMCVELCVVVCVRVSVHVWGNYCEVVCECMCMHMCRGEIYLSHTQGRSWALNTLWAPVSERGFLKLWSVWQFVATLSDLLDQQSHSVFKLPETL